MIINTQKRSRRTLLISIVVIIALLLGGYCFVAARNGLWPFSHATSEDIKRQAEVDMQKDQFVDKENASSKTKDSTSVSDNTQSDSGQTKDQKTLTSVIITYAGQSDDTVEVNAYMPDHYEDGTCTIAFIQGSQTVTRSSPAYRDATTTICTNPLIKSSDFPAKGQWSVSVSYDSTGASGTSTTQTVTVK